MLRYLTPLWIDSFCSHRARSKEAGFLDTLSFPATLMYLPTPSVILPMPRPSGLDLPFKGLSGRTAVPELLSPSIAVATPLYKVPTLSMLRGNLHAHRVKWHLGGTVIFVPHLVSREYLDTPVLVSGAIVKIRETFRGRPDVSQTESFRHLLSHSANIHGTLITRSLVQY